MLLCLVGGAGGVFGQGILAPPPEGYEQQGGAQPFATIQNGGIPPEITPPPTLATGLTNGLNGTNGQPGLATPENEGVPPLGVPPSRPAGPVQFGALDVHPHFLYQYIYGDGIPASPTNHEKTSIQEISPGLTVYWGDHWTLDYTPTLRLYSNRQFSDETDESAVLTGVAAYHDWGFKLSQAYSSSVSVLLETEAQTAQANYLTSFSVSRQLGSYLSANLELDQNFSSSTSTGLSQDVEEWSLTGGLNWQFMPQFGVGVSGVAGDDQISPGSPETFEELEAQMNFRPGKKLSMVASAGLEVRQLLGSQMVTPIFDATITYRPVEQTAASVSASRTVTPSLFQDEVLEQTSVSATVRQRVFKRFSVEVSGGYTTSPFVGFVVFSDANVTDLHGIPLVTVSQESRIDYYRFARVSLSCSLLKRGTASVFYEASDTTSGLSTINLTSTQVGVQLGYRF